MNIIMLKVAIVEPLPLIRAGLEAMLRKISGYKIQFFDIPADNDWQEIVSHYSPDIIFVNPLLAGLVRDDSGRIGVRDYYCVALLTSPMDHSLLHGYDEHLSIQTSIDGLRNMLERLYQKKQEPQENEEEHQALTNREKEIVVGVVKGMTNKEIAEELFLSTHTVITHRRNIAKKLQIHSPSGLTIYAIMNKLVNLDEITH
ncbi:response regulator transcription factor [Porphyromonas loveana]|uniref:response regulator transcription factor n=1 Tax=Porphyromonas loveana TaxID=1884669 RepID=UPI00359FB01E